MTLHDPTKLSSTSGSSELSQLLAQLNQEGGFSISVLTDAQGLAIAAASRDGQDPDRQSAIVALVQKTIGQVGKRLGLAETEEISMFTADGQRLVCRPFKTDNHDLILAITVPDKKLSYRRLTTRAITDILRIWSEYWE